MLAKRTDEVLGKLVALVYIAADFTAVAFFDFLFRLRLDVLMVIVVA